MVPGACCTGDDPLETPAQPTRGSGGWEPPGSAAIRSIRWPTASTASPRHRNGRGRGFGGKDQRQDAVREAVRIPRGDVVPVQHRPPTCRARQLFVPRGDLRAQPLDRVAQHRLLAAGAQEALQRLLGDLCARKHAMW